MENSLIFEHFNTNELGSILKIDFIKEMIYEVDNIYFTDYTSTRNEQLKTKIMDLIKLIDDNLQNTNMLNKIEISFLYFAKSMCLDKLPDYSKQAEESASKSVFIYVIS
jgi:hypothetical protein